MKYILILVLIGFYACKNNQSATQQNNSSTSESNVVSDTGNQSTTDTSKKIAEATTPTQSENKNDSLYRLVVFFYSTAGGAEFQLINELVDSLGVYGQNLGKKIDYKRVSWGREGETDVVMKLNELTPAQQADFVAMTRRVLAKGKYVTIYENYPWHQRGR